MLAVGTLFALVGVLGGWGVSLIRRAVGALRGGQARGIGRVGMNGAARISVSRVAVGFVSGILLLILAGASLLLACFWMSELYVLQNMGSLVRTFVESVWGWLFDQQGMPIGWILVFGGVVWGGRTLWAKWRRMKGRCPRCLYSREGLGEKVCCPECGLSIGEGKQVLRRRKNRWIWLSELGCLLAAFVADRVVAVRDSGWAAAIPTTVMIPLRHDLPRSFILWNYTGPRGMLSTRGNSMWQWQRTWFKRELREDIHDAKSLRRVITALDLLKSLDESSFDIDEQAGTRERLIRWGFDAYRQQNVTQPEVLELFDGVCYPIYDYSHLFDEYIGDVETMLRSGRDWDMKVGARFLRMFSREPRTLGVLEGVLGDHTLASATPGSTASLGLSRGRASVLRVAIRWPSDKELQRIVPGSKVHEDDSQLVLGNEPLLERLHTSQFVNGNALMRRQYLAWISEWASAQKRFLGLLPQIADDEVEVLAEGFLYSSYRESSVPVDPDEVQRQRRTLGTAIMAEYVKRPGCRIILSKLVGGHGDEFLIGQECLRENPAIESVVREELESGKSDRVGAALKVLSTIWRKGQTDCMEWGLPLEKARAGASNTQATHSQIDELLNEIRREEANRQRANPSMEMNSEIEVPVTNPK